MRGWASSWPSALRRAPSPAIRSSASRANCSASTPLPALDCIVRLAQPGQQQGRARPPPARSRRSCALELTRLFASQRRARARRPRRSAGRHEAGCWSGCCAATSCCCPRCSGQSCRFYPSCSNYAIEALRTHGAARGGWLAAAPRVPLPSVERGRRRPGAAGAAPQAFIHNRLRLQPLLTNTSMEINKRTILWIVFAVSLVVLWNNWMVANGRQSMFSPPPPPAKVATAPAPAPAPTAGVPRAGAPAPPPCRAPCRPRRRRPARNHHHHHRRGQGRHRHRRRRHPPPGTAQVPATGIGPATQEPGAVPTSTARTRLFYVAQTGLTWRRPAWSAAGLPNHNTPSSAKPGARTLDGANDVQLVLEAEQGGVKLTKTFTFKRGDYVIDVRHDVTNVGAAPVAPSLYLQLQHDGNKPEGDSYFNSSYTGPTLYTPEDKYQKLHVRRRSRRRQGRARDQGRTTAGSPSRSTSSSRPSCRRKTRRATSTPKKLAHQPVRDRHHHAAGHRGAGRHRVATTARLYSGPQDENLLEKITPGLDLVKDYGLLTIIAKPIFWVMDQMHSVHRQLGLDHHRLHHPDQAAVLPAVGGRLQEHGQDQAGDAEDAGDPRALQGRPGQDEPGHDGAVQDREDQSAGRLPADPGADAGVHRAVLGAAGLGRNARRAVDRLDPRPDRSRTRSSSCRCCTRSRCSSPPS